VSNSSEIPQIDPGLRARAARDFALYGAARLGLFLVLTVVIQGLAALIDARRGCGGVLCLWLTPKEGSTSPLT